MAPGPLLLVFGAIHGNEPAGRDKEFLAEWVTYWRKRDPRRLYTSGAGWLPPGLATLATNAQHLLRCVVPRGIPCAGLEATLPAAHRSDAGYTPYGLAYLAGGQAVRTPAALFGNVATVTPVAGALAYGAIYYPELTVWALRPTVSGQRAEATHRWELICEEV